MGISPKLSRHHQTYKKIYKNNNNNLINLDYKYPNLYISIVSKNSSLNNRFEKHKYHLKIIVGRILNNKNSYEFDIKLIPIFIIFFLHVKIKNLYL